MAYDLPTRSPEVLARHADACPARDGAPCTCGPIGYRPARDGRSAGPLRETEAQARAWRREQDAGLDAAERDPTVSVAIDEFVEAVAADRARGPGGRRRPARPGGRAPPPRGAAGAETPAARVLRPSVGRAGRGRSPARSHGAGAPR